MARFTKANIQFHSDRHDGGKPAINVKVYRSPGAKDFEMLARDQGDGWDRRFDLEWIRAHVSDERQDQWFNSACSDGWDQLTEDAREIFGQSARVYSEGRSSGWAVVYKEWEEMEYPHWLGDKPRKVKRSRPMFTREDVTSWDAIAVAKWGKFSRWATMQADDIPYQQIRLIYEHEYLPWREEEDQRLAKQAADARLSL